MKTLYKRNSANAICDVCGFKFKLTQLRKRWDGLWVCDQDWEMRHPMDFIRGRKESFDLPVTKPRPTDIYVNPPTLGLHIAVVNFAIVDYAIVNNTLGYDTLASEIPVLQTRSAVPGLAIIGYAIVNVNELFVTPANPVEG